MTEGKNRIMIFGTLRDRVQDCQGRSAGDIGAERRS
jgi:hypothetical protein